MPRGRRSKRQSSHALRDGEGPTRTEVFRWVQGMVNSVSVAAGYYSTLDLNPSALNSARLLTLSDTFQYMRFKRLKFELHPQGGLNITAGTAGYGCWYTPAQVANGPTSISEIFEYPHVIYLGSSQASPEQMSVGPKIVLGDTNLKWFRTRKSAGVDDVFEVQGRFGTFIASGVADQVISIRVTAEVEFRSPVPVSTIVGFKYQDLPAGVSVSTGPVCDEKGYICVDQDPNPEPPPTPKSVSQPAFSLGLAQPALKRQIASTNPR